MNYSLQFSGGVLQVTTSGKAQLKGFLKMIESILNHPAWHSNSKLLLDHTALDLTTLRFGDVLEITDYCAKHKNLIGSAKIAILVSDDLGLGMNRMWAGLVDGKLSSTGDIFKSRKQAWEWLTDPTNDC